MKNLMIVESPHKAKTIEKFLGPDYKVMSSVGHIRDLQKRGMSVDIADGFSPVYEIPADKKEVVKQLKAATRNADMVYLASDEDREGEAIAWHLYEVLGLTPENSRRIAFHEITKPAILEALAHPRGIDIDRVNAQQARRVLDRIVGFELSPILWKKIKPALSAGRVQSVATRLICEREKEINSFTPETFWRINATFTTASGKSFKAEGSRRFGSGEAASDFLQECLGKKFAVTGISVKPLTRKPLPPFTTSTLQQDAGRRLGFPVKQTMGIAQKLYEEGLITYMRTDSTNLSELALRDIAKAVGEDYGKDYLSPRRYHTSSKGAQEAHEAIRPTYIDRRTISGTPQEKKLYDLIWKRTVASQMSEARLEKTNVDIDIAGGESLPDTPNKGKAFFRAEGEIVKFEGFMRAYGIEAGDDLDSEVGNALLPPLAIGDNLDAEAITATERFSMPPARYSEASLVKKMEDLGIGRPSTYASTVSTIQARGYVKHGDTEGQPRNYTRLTAKNGRITETVLSENAGSTRGKLIPTDVGMVVNDFLTEYFPDILDYNFTARVEEKFDDIAEGKLPWQKELTDFYTGFHPLIDEVNGMRSEHKVGERILGIDPASGRRVSAKIGRFGPVVQIGEVTDEEKPRFASLGENQSLNTITLEEALKLFELPRQLGTVDDKPVTASTGRFGPYVHFDKIFVSIPKDLTPHTITLDQAMALIEAKKEAEANRLIKKFDELPGVEVLNGRFGPYVAYKKEGARKAVNYKIPKGTDAASLTADDVRKLMADQDAAPKTAKRSSAKSRKAK